MYMRHLIGWAGTTVLFMLASPAIADTIGQHDDAGGIKIGVPSYLHKPEIIARQKTPAQVRTEERKPTLGKTTDGRTMKDAGKGPDANAPDPGLIF